MTNIDRNISEKFFHLVRFSIKEDVTVPNISEQDWKQIYEIAEKQSLLGVLFEGVKKIKTVVPKEIFLNWLLVSEYIKQRNLLLNKACVKLATQLENDGFRYCILKGQGNAILYPNPLTRMPGDIDVWLDIKERKERNDSRDLVKTVIEYARKKNPQCEFNIIHADYGIFEGVDVELHYFPSYMHSPLYNYRIKHWFAQQESVFENYINLAEEGDVIVPTKEFNLVYLLSHIMKHISSEGVGLRQIMDYYFLLQSVDDYNKDEIARTLRYLGLFRLAGAVMYILNKVMGLEKAKLVVPVDEKAGEFLLKEILQGGNFGRYDVRKNWVNWVNIIGSMIRHFQRDLRFLFYFPSEFTWETLSRVYQRYWCFMHR